VSGTGRLLYRGRVLAGCLAALLFAASGCGHHGPDYRSIADAGQVADGGMRVEASAGEASTLNPILVSDSASLDLCSLIFNGLVRYGPKLVLEGDLARSWEVKDGGKTIVFHLRPGLRWQDGAPVTSADAKFTVERILDPKVASPLKSGFDLVQSMETPDALTLVVRYKKPFAPALEAWGSGLLPKHLLEGKDLNTDPFNRNPVGTGPFAFKEWKDKQYIELKANPDYYEGPVHISRFLVRFEPEPATQLLELKTGGIDGMTLQPDQYLHQTGDEAFARLARKLRFPGLEEYAYLGFNLGRAPFRDVRVRRALSMAIDRKELIDGTMLGLARPCSGPYSPQMQAYDPSVQPMPYDLTQAARLLDEAGFRLGADGKRAKAGKPLAFTIMTNQGNEPREKGALILQQQFAKLGVDVQVQTIEWSSFISNYVDKHNFDAVLLAWQITPDPDEYPIWHSSQTGPGGLNFLGFKDPETDRLLEQGRQTFDWNKRIALYRAFHRRLAELQPVAFLYSPDMLDALSLKFQGLLQTDTGYDWYWPTRWYVPKSVQEAQ
jgi:peptide/nickel transport system substrate-binding protein